jgi:starch synthase
MTSIPLPQTISPLIPTPATHRRARQPVVAPRRIAPVIVHVTAEYSPYARTGGLGEAVAGLAHMQQQSGREVMVFMPLYRAVRSVAEKLVPIGPVHPIRVGEGMEEVRFLRELEPASGPAVVFVDAPVCFDRGGIYGENGSDYPDNLRRFALFSRAVLDGISRFVQGPAIIHAHDWHSALVPVYLRNDEETAASLGRMPVVFSVHNAGYQGYFPSAEFDQLGLHSDGVREKLEVFGGVSLLRGGLAFSDHVVTVSPAHAGELCTTTGGFGLDGDFRTLGSRLSGICNGIDQELWNPESDPFIASNYHAGDLSGKSVCKAELQRELGLPARAEIPLVGMATRLVAQKGFDLILASERMRRPDAQFVFIGQGEPRYHEALAALAAANPGRIAVNFAFTDALEHRLVAGADYLLMPSLYEPCGLTQMRAQRYGVPVIARRVGGLGDTVEDGKTGFVFDDYAVDAFDVALDRALAHFHDGQSLEATRKAAMKRDFGWRGAARQYSAIYAAACRKVVAAI